MARRWGRLKGSEVTNVKVKTRDIEVKGKPMVERTVEYVKRGETRRFTYTTSPERAEAETAQAAVSDLIAGKIASAVGDKLGRVVDCVSTEPYFVERTRHSAEYLIGGQELRIEFWMADYGWERRKHEIILPDAKTGNYRGSPDIIYDLTVNRDGTPKFGKTVAKRLVKLIVEADRRRREREAAKRRKIKANLHAQCLLNLLRREARGKGVVFALAGTWGDTAEVVVRSKRGKVTTNRRGDAEFHSVVTVNVEVTADGLGGIEVFSHPGRLEDPADALEEVGRVTANMARLCKLARLEIASLTHLEAM